MKKFIMGFLTAALLFTAIPIGAAVEEYICYRADYKVMVTGTEYINDELPILNYKGSTYAPFRSILEAAGLNVSWNAELRRAEVTIAPVPEPTKGADRMSDVPLNKYGLPDFSNYTGEKPTINHKERNNYFTFNGVKYISIANYSEDCDDNLIPSNYRFEQTFINGKLSGIIQFTTIDTETHEITILIEEVPYTYLNEYYFEYDYYVNTILPLIK